MPKKNKTQEEHFLVMEILLAGLILKRDVDLKQVSKVIGISDKTLSKFFPERKKKKQQTK